METMRHELQIQRDIVVAEVAGLASADEASVLLEGVFSSLDSHSVASRVQRPGTSMSEEIPLGLGNGVGSPYLRARRLSSMSASTARGNSGRAVSLAPTTVSDMGDGHDLDLGDLERAGLQRAVRRVSGTVANRPMMDCCTGRHRDDAIDPSSPPARPAQRRRHRCDPVDARRQR
jgi:hypothetical protein